RLHAHRDDRHDGDPQRHPRRAHDDVRAGRSRRDRPEQALPRGAAGADGDLDDPHRRTQRVQRDPHRQLERPLLLLGQLEQPVLLGGLGLDGFELHELELCRRLHRLVHARERQRLPAVPPSERVGLWHDRRQAGSELPHHREHLHLHRRRLERQRRTRPLSALPRRSGLPPHVEEVRQVRGQRRDRAEELVKELIVRKLILQQDGMALVLALIVMLVLTTGAATAYFYAQSNSRESTQSRAQGDASHAAEAGLSAAIAVIQNPNNNDQDSTLFGSAGNMTLICVDPNVAAVNGSCPAGQRTWATYGGSLDTSGSASVWTLTAYGYAANTDSQGARPIQHKVSAQIQLQAENDTSAVDDSWSYLFSTQTQSANKACDQTYTTQISTFVYAQGNLCLSGNGEFIDSSSHSTKVEANGYIELQSSTNSFVGTSTNSAVGTVKTNFGCIYSGTTYHPCATSSAHQFIKSSSGTTDGITPPVVDWDAWYRS